MRIAILHGAEDPDETPDPVFPQVEEALRALEHDPVRVPVDDDIGPVIAALRRCAPGLVFNLTESFAGKSALDSNLAALLNLLDLRYTGSSPSGLMLSGDKSLMKQVLRFHGIPTPQFATVFRGALDHAGELTFPLIVKPPQEDASIGITTKSVVRDVKELLGTMDALQREFQSSVLVEEFVDGREFYVGVLGNAAPQALPVIELDFSAFPPDRPKIASWEAKWGEGGTGAADERGAEFVGTKSVIPTDLPSELVERMQQVAVAAFHALRLRDYARVDLRVTADERIFVLEANPNCYLERTAEFSRAALEAGLSHVALVGRILELAQGRYAR